MNPYTSRLIAVIPMLFALEIYKWAGTQLGECKLCGIFVAWGIVAVRDVFLDEVSR